MTFPKLALLSVLVAVLTVLAPHDGYAQKKKKEPVPEKPILTVQSGDQSKSLQLQRIVNTIPASSPIGDIIVGLFCMKITGEVRASARQPLALYGRIFQRELSAAGYRVVGDPNDLFEDRDDNGADLQVGVLILNQNMDVCYQYSTFEESRGSGSIQVEWQIYDRLQRKVIFKAVTSGKSSIPSKTRGEDDILPEAFGAALRDLLRDEKFYAVVTNKTEAAKSEDPSATSAPAATIAISRLPLSAQRFQDRSADTRGNVVTIFADGKGSGFFVSDRLLLTNQHVVGGAKFVKVKLITGREILGEVLTKDAIRDVALVQTEASGLPGLPIFSGELPIGSGVFAVGSPLGERNEGTVSSGIISSYRTDDALRYIQSDVNVMPGNSGGPLLDEKGNVIGITVAGQIDPRTGGSAGLNLFIPITDAMAKLGLQFR